MLGAFSTVTLNLSEPAGAAEHGPGWRSHTERAGLRAISGIDTCKVGAAGVCAALNDALGHARYNWSAWKSPSGGWHGTGAMCPAPVI